MIIISISFKYLLLSKTSFLKISIKALIKCDKTSILFGENNKFFNSPPILNLLSTQEQNEIISIIHLIKLSYYLRNF